MANSECVVQTLEEELSSFDNFPEPAVTTIGVTLPRAFGLQTDVVQDFESHLIMDTAMTTSRRRSIAPQKDTDKRFVESNLTTEWSSSNNGPAHHVKVAGDLPKITSG